MTPNKRLCEVGDLAEATAMPGIGTRREKMDGSKLLMYVWGLRSIRMGEEDLQESHGHQASSFQTSHPAVVRTILSPATNHLHTFTLEHSIAKIFSIIQMSMFQKAPGKRGKAWDVQPGVKPNTSNRREPTHPPRAVLPTPQREQRCRGQWFVRHGAVCSKNRNDHGSKWLVQWKGLAFYVVNPRTN